MQHNFRPLSFSVRLLSSPVLLSLLHWFRLITPVSQFSCLITPVSCLFVSVLFLLSCLLSDCACLIASLILLLLFSVVLFLSHCFCLLFFVWVPVCFCIIAPASSCYWLPGGATVSDVTNTVRVGCPGFSFRLGHIVLSLHLFTGLAALLWYIFIATLSISR